MKRHFDKTAAEIIGEKINSVKESIKTREAVIGVIETVNDLIKDFNKKVFNNRVLNALNAELQSLNAPFTLETTDQDRAQIGNYKKMVKPLQKAFDAFEAFAAIPGSAYIDAEHFIEKSFITETFYMPSPAFHVYYDLLQSTFKGL